MHEQKNNLLLLASILFGSASYKILVINAEEEISVMRAQDCIMPDILSILKYHAHN